jgi:hypothetical protein
MILCVVITETNKKTGLQEQVVSHGVDLDTGRSVILPAEHPGKLGAVFDPGYGEYLILGKPSLALDDESAPAAPSRFHPSSRTSSQ